MILGIIRLFKSLSGYHYTMILITILLPVIGPSVIAQFAPDYPHIRVILRVAAFLVWSLFVVLVVASMVRRERSEAEQRVAQQIAALSGQIGRLKKQQEYLNLGLRREVDNLEKVVRTTLFESLGVVLPHRPITVNFRFDMGSPTVSLTSGGPKLTRLRQWLGRLARRHWVIFYGKSEGS